MLLVSGNTQYKEETGKKINFFFTNSASGFHSMWQRWRVGNRGGRRRWRWYSNQRRRDAQLADGQRLRAGAPDGGGQWSAGSGAADVFCKLRHTTPPFPHLWGCCRCRCRRCRCCCCCGFVFACRNCCCCRCCASEVDGRGHLFSSTKIH